jgi:hypothetical protein
MARITHALRAEGDVKASLQPWDADPSEVNGAVDAVNQRKEM